MVRFILCFVLYVAMIPLTSAEYRAVLKFKNPEAGLDDKGQPIYTLWNGVDDVDLKACEAIAENIRTMEKAGVNWSCDFPISANNYLLSKPQWVQIFDDEKVEALNILNPNRKGDAAADLSLFYALYGNSSSGQREKIYAAPYPGYECKPGYTDSRIELKFPREWGARPMINNDAVIFSSRFYFVKFSAVGYSDSWDVPDRSFFVTALRDGQRTGKKIVAGVCAVYPTN